ncbi:MAG: F420-dependent oxidoreductase, family [Frankiales bacterium]|nr:F420-dependent oxidoreductase, family [Frankiales bacterium]
MTTFGYFLSAEELSPRKIVDTARTAETAGFDRVWLSDHFHPWTREQGESAFVWSVLGALATSTDLHLTTAVTCPTFRIHPAVIAQATATTAALAPGRFTFGVGSGEALNEHVLGDAWPPVSVRHDRLREAIAIIRELWAGGVVTHEGEHYTVHDARIFSLPEQLPEILVSGFGPEATKLAAEIGDGWITVQPDKDGMSTYREAGGSGRTQAGAKICWAETEQEAAETAHRLWGFQGAGGQTSQDLPLWLGFEGIRELTHPDDIAKAVPCGPDPEKAAEALREYVEAGFDEVYVAQMGPDQEGGIRFLTEQVLPLLEST